MGRKPFPKGEASNKSTLNVQNWRANNPDKYKNIREKQNNIRKLLYGGNKEYRRLYIQRDLLSKKINNKTNKYSQEEKDNFRKEREQVNKEMAELREKINIEVGLENIKNNTLNSNSINNTTISINNDDSNLSSISSTTHVTSVSEQNPIELQQPNTDNDVLQDSQLHYNPQLDNQQLANQQTPNQPNPQCRFIQQEDINNPSQQNPQSEVQNEQPANINFHNANLPLKKRPFKMTDAEERGQESQTQEIWQPWN